MIIFEYTVNLCSSINQTAVEYGFREGSGEAL